MSIINDDPNAQADADAERGIAPVIGGTPKPISVQKIDSDDSPSMPKGGLKPLHEHDFQVDVDKALADDTPGTASFDGPRDNKFVDFSDFIEAPIDDTPEETETKEEKSINIVDETPEAENLIDDAEEPAEEPKEEPKAEPKNDGDLKIDPEHAVEEANEDFFRALNERVAKLRRERNELIVQADKKEDEMTMIERYNSQYDLLGEFDKIERDRVESLRNEVRDLREQSKKKDHSIRSILKTIRTM